MIFLKRVYDPASRKGKSFLIDRLWPRGIKKAELKFDGWMKNVAPSPELRQWFGHDAGKWNEFRSRYFKELNKKPESWQPLIRAAKQGDIILLFAAKDLKYNNAVALKNFLESQLDN